MKKIVIFCVALLTTLIITSCSSVKVTSQPVSQKLDIRLNLVDESVANKFVDLDYGIILNVQDSRATEEVLKMYDANTVLSINLFSKPKVSLYPDVSSFVNESIRVYMRNMGFALEADISTDYYLAVKIKEFNVSYLSGAGWSGLVQMGIEVYDNNRKQVYPNVTVTGRTSVGGSATDSSMASKALNEAFVAALEDVSWDKIAFFLKKSGSPSLEKNKKVTGEGNTALESTVIRWYIDSSPRGSDVYTRVISSTSDVKNTNQTYVGTTPYETTETFDIKGLTYNNSGNVQIEVICEKAGYILQKKRFNLRQAIDQKEISTKFNLVKEE